MSEIEALRREIVALREEIAALRAERTPYYTPPMMPYQQPYVPAPYFPGGPYPVTCDGYGADLVWRNPAPDAAGAPVGRWRTFLSDANGGWVAC